MRIHGQSTALYSTWLHVPELRLLIDAGDGAAAALRSACKEIDVIAITHQHRDHVAGLLEVLSWAAFERSCEVLYPAGSDTIEGIRASAKRQGVSCAPAATWTALRPGDRVSLLANGERSGGTGPASTVVELLAFRAPHVVGQSRERALGFAVVQGGAVRLAVTGDCAATALDLPGRPDVLLRDCSYLRREDAHASTGGLAQHGLLEDVLEVALADRPGHLVLYHLNERYGPAESAGWVESACRSRRLPFPVSVLWPGDPVADVTASPLWSP